MCYNCIKFFKNIHREKMESDAMVNDYNDVFLKTQEYAKTFSIRI